MNEVNDGGLEILVFSETLASWVFSFQILVIYLSRFSKRPSQIIFLALENGPDFGDLGDFCPLGVFGECRCSGLDPDEVPDDGLEIEPDDGLDDELELEDGLEGLDPLLELLELLELELLDESELDDDEDDEDDDEDEDEDEDEDDEAENNPKI